MRKKTISCLVDEIFWAIIYLLPLAFMLGVSVKTGTFVDFSTAMSSVGLNILVDNPIYTTINDLIGANGVVPMLADGIICYFAYFVTCWIAHIIVDILLWLPRFCHKLLSKAGE